MYKKCISRTAFVVIWCVMFTTFKVQAESNPYFDYRSLRPSPQVASYANNNDVLEISEHTHYELLVSPAMKPEADRFVGRLKSMQLDMFEVNVVVDQSLDDKGSYSAILRSDMNWKGPDGFPINVNKNQGYSLEITGKGIVIQAVDDAGSFYSFQTIMQIFLLAGSAQENGSQYAQVNEDHR